MSFFECVCSGCEMSVNKSQTWTMRTDRSVLSYEYADRATFIEITTIDFPSMITEPTIEHSDITGNDEVKIATLNELWKNYESPKCFQLYGYSAFVGEWVEALSGLSGVGGGQTIIKLLPAS